MKFLCVPCDSPMKLQTVGPPERGSLSVVYACPACGYEIAMLTNAYETQVVQSLGVRIGPAGPDPSAEAGCPFSAMMQTTSAVPGIPAVEPVPGSEARPGEVDAAVDLRWTAAAEARLANIPAFVRPMARTGIERFARERGRLEVDEHTLDAAREFFGM
jgi:hypothetical protein